jgi:two-component system LytT family response regulator
VINSSTESNSQQYVNLFENLDVNKTSKIAVPVKDGVSFIDPHDIIWMQADGSYTYIFTDKDKFTATKNIKEYEDLLSDRKFFRVHNSYLINLKHVKHFVTHMFMYCSLADMFTFILRAIRVKNSGKSIVPLPSASTSLIIS